MVAARDVRPVCEGREAAARNDGDGAEERDQGECSKGRPAEADDGYCSNFLAWILGHVTDNDGILPRYRQFVPFTHFRSIFRSACGVILDIP